MIAPTSIARGHNSDPSARKRRWRTPPELFRSLDAEFRFGLDAAAEPGANLCARYIGPVGSTPLPGEAPPAALDCLTVRWIDVCPYVDDLPGWSWLNSPWGPRFDACAPDCRTDHAHHPESFPGTGAFVEAAIRNARTGLGVVLLVPTAPDTSWWRAAFAASVQVRLTPRIAFIDPETGKAAPAPPGCGCSLFVMRGRPLAPVSVVVVDRLGRVS